MRVVNAPERQVAHRAPIPCGLEVLASDETDPIEDDEDLTFDRLRVRAPRREVEPGALVRHPRRVGWERAQQMQTAQCHVPVIGRTGVDLQP